MTLQAILLDESEQIENVGAIVASLWEAAPFKLVNWWDMEEFSAAAFYYIGTYLRQIQMKLGNFPREQVIEGGLLNPDTDAGKLLVSIRELCARIGLRVSVRSLDDLVSIGKRDAKSGELVDAYGHLEKIIQHEMQEKLFMFIPTDRADFYNKPESFGKEVNAKFPAVQFDIVEAGNCYAAGRGTACVFHLMRIMEAGVQQFGDKLRIPLVHETNWQTILDQINKQIRALPQKDSATISMSEAAANLYAVKLAWRNEVMHPKETYTPEEAENIFRQVKLFMQQLATIV